MGRCSSTRVTDTAEPDGHEMPRQYSTEVTPAALSRLRQTEEERVQLDGRFTGERQTLYQGTTPGFALANITATTTLSRSLDLQFGLYNALNQKYADPGAEEHLQRAIAQDGRTVRVRLMARF